MLANAREFAADATPPRHVTRRLVVVAALLVLFTGVIAAATTTATKSSIQNQIQQIGNFIIYIIIGVAVPNGAYGFLEWMTAGSSVEKDEQGRKRIRNTFIALAGAGIIKGAVMVVSSMMGLP